ncbi:hypothetical protein AVEN_6339-1 [Araneus ventricosus]|uniref:Uncharacterized protein n=1 Tax=Araneus ventricosus TaxID=182803 RepID=A0A4Y2BW36_ARAVE|nr:hypothetical protein AVEN_6339-1 [Araneus ventricosus]
MTSLTLNKNLTCQRNDLFLYAQGYHTAGFQAHSRTNVRIDDSECSEREIWLRLRKSEVSEKEDVIPTNSQFASIVDEKVNESSHPVASSN